MIGVPIYVLFYSLLNQHVTGIYLYYYDLSFTNMLLSFILEIYCNGRIDC
jgi:hypothetical protein